MGCTVGNIGTIAGCGVMILFGVFQAFVCRHMLNPCNVVNFEIVHKDITQDQAASMFKKVADEGPNAANMMFIMSLTCRLESACFVGMGIAAACVFAAPLEERYTGLLVFGIVGLLCISVSLNHGGCLPFFGTNPFLTDAGKGEAKSIIGLWVVALSGVWTAFGASLKLKNKVSTAATQLLEVPLSTAIEPKGDGWVGTFVVAVSAGVAGAILAVAVMTMLSRRSAVREPTLLG